MGRKEEELFWTGMEKTSEEVLDNLRKTACKHDCVPVTKEGPEAAQKLEEDQEKGTKGHAENPA